MKNIASKIESSECFIRPLLKWAGGKAQLVDKIIPKIPLKYNKYIEPFFGGGALFFALQPSNSIISDSNPELINLYKAVANNVDELIERLRFYKNNKDVFYSVRNLDWAKLHSVEAAARTLYLNRTCFNGLYRVNKSGQFNVPFGNYKNPKIIDESKLISVSTILKNTTIICGDYKQVLKKFAQPGDFIFLDPPYLPISEYADFKRYTKEQFHEKDHIALNIEIMRLHDLGCFVILTNSNHPMVSEQYGKFIIDVVQTKRNISCKGKRRIGEDVIVVLPSKKIFSHNLVLSSLPRQAMLYPSTRFMGSKNKLLPYIWAIISQFEFKTVLDLFSGSGIVSYMLKSQGKSIISNDYMVMAATFTKAMIENNNIVLSEKEIAFLLGPNNSKDCFIQDKFKGLYFCDEDNILIDTIRSNIKKLKNQYKKAIAMTALIRTCLKKRPRGMFSYVGYRYDDKRKDLLKSFRDHYIDAVKLVNEAVFDNGKQNYAYNLDSMTLMNADVDLVYLDPPYYSPLSDNEYVRRYHFVEGLARDWQNVEIQEHTVTKKFKSYPTPFSTRQGAIVAFETLFKRFKKSILVVSYSSNSQPTLEEIVAIMNKHKKYVDVVPVNYKYSFGNQSHKIGNNNNSAKEYIFIGY